MILAKELRIGNKFIGIAGVQTVISILDNLVKTEGAYKSEYHKLMYSHLIMCEENGNQYKPCEIEPIPITPEILENYGFVKEKNRYAECGYFYTLEYLHNPQPGQFLDKVRFVSGTGKDVQIVGMNWVSCGHLHLFQNIFFSLTGTDLIAAQNPARSVATDDAKSK